MKRRRMQRFWVDLKRRRMFSAGALYAVCAWALVQAASIAFPAFGIPDSVLRAVLVAAFAVVPAARTARLSAQHRDMQSMLASAAADGITHVLSGEILHTPRGLTVTSRLTDLRRNVELGANRQEGLQPEEALTFSTAIASVVKQGLGLPGTEKVDVFAANFASRNITAYEAFIAGMQDFL